MVTTTTQGISSLSCHLTLHGHPLVGPQTTGSQILRIDQDRLAVRHAPIAVALLQIYFQPYVYGIATVSE